MKVKTVEIKMVPLHKTKTCLFAEIVVKDSCKEYIHIVMIHKNILLKMQVSISIQLLIRCSTDNCILANLLLQYFR